MDLHALAREHRTDNGNGLEKESQRAKCATVPLGTVNRKIEKNNNFTILCDSVPVGTVAHLAHLTGYTFTDKIDMGEWPTFLLPILNCQQDTADRDKMMLGALNILSGIIPKSLYGIYDRRKIYAPLYNIIFGGFATKKGDLEPFQHSLNCKRM